MKIIHYNTYSDIIVEFQDNYNAKVHTSYQCFKKGRVKNPYHKTTIGTGYLGEGIAKENGKLKKSYKVWFAMIDRCYGNNESKNPSYKGCNVCEEWHNYGNFEKWFNENFYQIKNEDMELDKDILLKHNKIYCPQYCCFVPSNINCLFTKSDKIRGECPIGVTWHKRDLVYEAWCSDRHKKDIYLGRFNDKNKAFLKYKQYKENLIKKIANEYKEYIPENLYSALINYEVEITD